MKKNMNQAQKKCTETRDQVVLFLLFFTSDNCLQAYENTNPKDRLAFELSRIWFDEIYIPGMTYLSDGLKGDFSEKSAKEFEKCFSQEEFKSIERFHRFFELRMDMLSDKMKKKKSIPQNDSWLNLKKHASYLLDELEPDANKKTKQLERLVREGLLKDGSWRKDKFALP